MLKRFFSNGKTFKIKTGAEMIFEKLLNHKVKDVFLYSGGSIMPLVDQFYNGGINYYINTHEQNCGHAATGYAKSSNKMGVVISTSGPGITNLITPMLDAQTDGVPLLVLSGQVGTNFIGTGAFQEAPACEITKPVTKLSYCIKDINQISFMMDHAINLIHEGRPGVVHLDLPKNILVGTYHQKNEDDNILKPLHTNDFDEEKIIRIADSINRSTNPIFFLGKGCSSRIINLVEKTKIPFTTTIHSKGIISEDHSLSLKWCGMHGSAAANFALQQADCIIGIGARFDDRTTGLLEKYAPKADNIINVNIDPSSFGKTVNSNLNLTMDSDMFIKNIEPLLDNFIPTLKWLENISNLKKKYPFKYNIPLDGKLNTQMAISMLNKLTLGKSTIFTTGVGNHQMMAYQFIKGDYPGKIHSSGSLGVMGAGLPYSIGAQIANPEKLVVNIDGDSSFLMTMSDMKTIVENNLPVKIAIMNDSRQMMVNIWERLFFDERYTATVNRRNPSFKDVAEGFGIKGLMCRNADELEDVTREFIETEGPCLCEYKVVPEICLPLVGPGKGLDEMILFDEYHENEKIEFDKNFIPS
jgi:acetolactate synthase I/II/III large subunit